MKTALKCFAGIVYLSGLVGQLHSQGYIVPNGVSYYGLEFAGGYEIDVIHNPINAY